jgi:hypothetical protein
VLLLLLCHPTPSLLAPRSCCCFCSATPSLLLLRHPVAEDRAASATPSLLKLTLSLFRLFYSRRSTQREQRNLNKIGKQNAQVRSKMYGGKVNSVSAGISTGIKTKNVHMQQFHNIRKQQQGRMENIRKGSVGGGTRGARGMGAGGKSSTMSGSRAMGGRKPVGGTRLNKTTGTRPAAGSRARPIPAANRGVRGGYKTTTGRSNNRGPPPKGASRFPAVKGASVGGRSVGGSGLSAVRAKAVRKKW